MGGTARAPTATPRQKIPSLNEHSRGGQSKVDRYGWKLIDRPGVYENIDKKRLGIDESYQRPEIVSKIREMSANWSWMACGVILVARRGKRFYVYDGQQRTAAAMRRSDIKTLPCLVFDTEALPGSRSLRPIEHDAAPRGGHLEVSRVGRCWRPGGYRT
jgi:hypothetical protein